ncbi:MAG: DNA alkylation repair protein [Candidatus Kerfeldbacteria bacterium]|nr:DNA alkylation repair protein [Candidatus Kerfeldbacteria bacterium]
MPRLNQVRAELQRLSKPSTAKTRQWFFQTGHGEYSEGDIFIGVSVPEQRRVARKYRDLPLADVERLLQSRYHEHRLTALFILVSQFQRRDQHTREIIAKRYLRWRKQINNWDLVDSSAPHILGTYLLDKPRLVLSSLAASRNLWERRMSIIATQTFIRHGQFRDTLNLAKKLLRDPHDLIHKAVGWMLREVGDRDRPTEERFLKRYARQMPRTMLRYAIEKFPPAGRRQYLGR